MLQQTLVATVVPYFTRFMKRFPTVKKLARAEENTVFRTWEGLGYYSRARNLHRAAKIIVKNFSGKIPTDRETLESLPGIGRYTSASIGSLAFGKPWPVLDANVRRILARLVLHEQHDENKNLLSRMISLPRPGNFNEAIMELGALVCTPRNPSCPSCPVRSHCLAWKRNLVAFYPQQKKRSITALKGYPAVLVNRGQLLVSRRGSTSGMRKRFENLYSLPHYRKMGNRYQIDGLRAELRKKKPLPACTHVYTRFREKLYPALFELRNSPRIIAPHLSWVALRRISKIPFPSVYRRILTFRKVPEPGLDV